MTGRSGAVEILRARVASADDHLGSDTEIPEAPNWTIPFTPQSLRGTPGQAKIPETRLHDSLTIEAVARLVTVAGW